MKIPFTTKLVVLGTLLLVLGILFQPLLSTSMVLAQDNNAPAADTPTSEPPTPLPTNTAVPPATATSVAPTNTPSVAPTNTPTTVPPKPASGPVPIPEPVTVVLFGTGLAAISAAAAARRKKGN